MLSKTDLTLRGVNFIFIIIGLGLSGSLVAGTPSGAKHSEIEMCLFATVWALITSTIYGGVTFLYSVLTSPLLLWVLDLLNTVFTFAGATALAAALKAHSCSNKAYVEKNGITLGSSDRCKKSQADVTFIYFSFLIFLLSLINQSINVVQSGALKSSQPTKRPEPRAPNVQGDPSVMGMPWIPPVSN